MQNNISAVSSIHITPSPLVYHHGILTEWAIRLPCEYCMVSHGFECWIYEAVILPRCSVCSDYVFPEEGLCGGIVEKGIARVE